MANDTAFQYEMTKKHPGLPIALELIGGFFFQTFGIGNMVSGNVGVGLALLFGYWAIQVVNVMLMLVLIGFVTAPLTWIAFMVIGPVLASNEVQRQNRALYGRLSA